MEEKYPSGKILLDIAKSEYENEKNRTSIIDSKANIVISLSAVFFVAMTQIVDLKTLLKMKINTFTDVFLPSILFITIIGALIIAFISLVFFMRVIFTKTYMTLDANYFYDINKLKREESMYSIATSQFYIEATNANKQANDHRIKNYKRGLITLIISIAVFALHTVLLSII